MKKEFSMYYDEEGDFLEVRVGKARKEYYEDIGDDIFKRIDEKTGKVIGWAIFNFKKRTKKFKEIDIPMKLEIIA